MIYEWYVVLLISFGLGLMHALDADHILAVSVLSADKSSLRKSLRYAFQWSAGHGLILLLVIIVVYSSGLAMPAFISDFAEQLVGAVLIALGLLLIYRLQKYRLHIHFHVHDGLLPHAHWHQNEVNEHGAHQHEHKAYLIGSLHGMAGSAPLLAMIPLFKTDQLLLSVLYLCIFSLGVFIAMVCFGGVFGSLMQKMAKHSMRYATLIKVLLGIMSIGMGVHLVSG